MLRACCLAFVLLLLPVVATAQRPVAPPPQPPDCEHTAGRSPEQLGGSRRQLYPPACKPLRSRSSGVRTEGAAVAPKRSNVSSARRV
jgi:hypothetical protein